MNELLVLCYHAISPQWSAGLSVTPEAFERQIVNLVRHGWRTSTFSECVRQPSTAKTVVITFDDAFLSVKRYAEPILSELDIRATVFVPTDYISRGAPLAWPGLDHWQHSPDATELTPMTWDDLCGLSELGWEIGSHTRTHPPLTTLDDDCLIAELADSREECAQRIGRPVTSLAYPYGNVDDRVETQTRRAGYEAAATLTWPTNHVNLHRFPRVGVYHKDSWPRFRVKVGRWSRSSYGARLLALRS